MPPTATSSPSRLSTVLYSEEEAWEPLPRWIRFLACVGRTAIRDEASGHRNVVALALPTRAFAAAFVTLGVIQARLGSDDGSADGHLAMLRSVPTGTRVRLRAGDKLLRGILLSTGADYIKVEVGQGLIRSVPISDAERVQIANGGRQQLPRIQQPRPIVDNPAFCRALLGGADPHTHASEARVETLILGHLTALRTELCETRLAVPSDTGLEEGVLQDVLRARCFSPSSKSHASEIATVAGTDAPRLDPGERPIAVVFDGATGFLRFREDWRSSHWVVILDRTEPSFEAAANELNEEYVLLRSGADWRPRVPNAPRGVEIAAYREQWE